MGKIPLVGQDATSKPMRAKPGMKPVRPQSNRTIRQEMAVKANMNRFMPHNVWAVRKGRMYNFLDLVSQVNR